MGKLAPSILAADFARLGEQAQQVSEAGCDYLHIDVMDGHFVPNISFGPGVMRSLDRLETSPYDVHLMISDPDRYLDAFVTEKTAFITVHQEACLHLHRTLTQIRSLGIRAGVAVNPATPVSLLEPVLDLADLVLVMSVNPGFGGQRFIPGALAKIRQLDALRRSAGYGYAIEIDGGVTTDNAAEICAAGCDILVAGSSVFGAADPAAQVRTFRSLIG